MDTMISIFMDVEDPVNPLADDATLDFARLFTEVGVRGSFCVTGEKCRKLVERGRQDVIEALLPHCLGLHTDTHSYHPTTMELLADVEYSKGCELAFEAESKGCDAFRQAFGRMPTFWGGAGNTWSPEICHALARLGVPAYVYSLTEVPGKGVHRFNGAVALPQSFSFSEQAVSEAVPAPLPAFNGWAGVFVGHPTRYRYPDYWDRSFYLGQTPAEPDLMEPVEEEIYEQAKDNLRVFLIQLRAQHQILGVDEALDLPWRFRAPTPEEQEHFQARTPLNIRAAGNWPIHRPNLDVTRIVEKTLALSGTLEVATLPSDP